MELKLRFTMRGKFGRPPLGLTYPNPIGRADGKKTASPLVLAPGFRLKIFVLDPAMDKMDLVVNGVKVVAERSGFTAKDPLQAYLSESDWRAIRDYVPPKPEPKDDDPNDSDCYLENLVAQVQNVISKSDKHRSYVFFYVIDRCSQIR